MIIFDLVCEFEHEFEGWFKDAAELTEQQNCGLLTCPFCDSANVFKKIAAPKVSKKSNTSTNLSSAKQKYLSGGAGSENEYKQVQEMLKQVHDYIDQNFQDVGNNFADEAKSIHRGEKDAISIKGTASKEQLKELSDEGISTLPIPPRPVDKSKIN